MTKKIFAWIMLIINIIMVLYVMTDPSYRDMIAWMLFVFGGELYLSIKYLESLK